jgi:phage shock protein PspC (stress-responsive transcriptional regulator)
MYNAFIKAITKKIVRHNQKNLKEKKERENMKTLRKSRDRRIAGVCGGIAEYFGWDPTIIRIIWAVMIFCYGTGLLAYIVAAIIMPEG